MGSTALAAAVVLPRYGGLNYACGINEDWKRTNVTLHNFVQCSCKNIEQKCFIYHQIYHGDWESHRECLINTCINGWRHGIEYTQVQKLSNLLQGYTYVQISINYFHKAAAGAVLFTVYLHLTWNQFHSTLYPTEDRQKTCPMYVKLTSFAFVMSQ